VHFDSSLRQPLRLIRLYAQLVRYFNQFMAARVARNLENLWNAKDISKDTKVLVYRSLVQSILYYTMPKRGL